MDIDGDIRVWTEGDKVCARLHANGPEGPIVVQASAPLAPIRRRLVRAFARRGVTISGSEPGYGATIESIARKKALKRLQYMAPAAFSKRGLASYIARSELMKRRRRRKALARAGQPVGAKPIGPVPPVGPARQKRRRRSRRFGKWVRPLVPAALVATTAALMPFIARPGARSVARALPPSPPPPPRPTGGSALGPASASYGSPGGATSPEANDSAAEEESYEDEAQDASSADASRTDASEDTADGVEANEGDGDAEGGDDGEGEEDSGEGGGEDAEVGFSPAPPAPRLTRRHVRQAMVLLHAARRHPRARRRLHQIVELAGVGEPAAKKALTALKVAKKIKAKKKAPTAKVAPRLLAQAPKALVLAQASPALPATPALSTTSKLRRWLDVFAPWRRGVG
jgi:hypothetical protein